MSTAFWTPERDRELLALRAKGLSGAQMAAAMGKSCMAIAMRLSRLKAPVAERPPPRKYPFWTNAEDARLREMFLCGAPASAIAAAIGRQVSAIINRIDRQGLRRELPPPPPVVVERPVAVQREPGPPLPVGHPVTWGAITRGTILDGRPCVAPGAVVGAPTRV